jgi:hypothetical protein
MVCALLAALALSAAGLAAGRGDAGWAAHARPAGAYRFDGGWLGYRTSPGGGGGSLRELSGGAAAVGLACGAALAASAVLAGVYCAVLLCGCGGPHIAAAATPAR